VDAAVSYKQLDDYRAGKRSWGAMNGIAQALSQQASADVAVYYAAHTNGLAPAANDVDPPAQNMPAVRLVFDGDPSRGIPPCAACHGPNEIKLGAPALKGQQPAYIERQLAAFAQGMRQNDIDVRMRTIVSQLTAIEMHNLAEFYAAGVDSKVR
jgi:cytochrome c553